MPDVLEYKVPFFMIANDIFEIGLNPYQIAVYSYLCRCGNNSKAFPSYQTIADKTGMSKRKAITIVKELIEKGLIEKITRKKSNDDNETNIYNINTPSVQNALGGVHDALGSVHDAPNKELPKNNSLKITNNLGKFSQKTPTYHFSSLDISHLEPGVIHYIGYYLKTIKKNEPYTLEKWDEIFKNLYDIGLCEFDNIANIVDQYLDTKFKEHSLYHSTLHNVLENRMYELKLM